MSLKQEYALHLPNTGKKPKPVDVQHPLTGETVGSWTYIVTRTDTDSPWIGKDKVKLRTLFDFEAQKVVTIDPATDIITAVNDFGDEEFKDDVQQAAQWLHKTHPQWCFKK